MNLLHLCGFLGADPEEKYTPNGQKLWELRLATRSYKGGQEETLWWRITVWGDQFDNMLRHFKKGKPIYIVAEMNKLGTYTDKAGQTQVSYEATARSIHFLPSNERQEGTQQQGGGYGQQQHGQQAQAPQQYQQGYGAQHESYGSQQHSQAGPFAGGMPQQGFGGESSAQQPVGAPLHGTAADEGGFSSGNEQVPF